MAEQQKNAWAGRTPRRWQAEAIEIVMPHLERGEAGVVSAVMGSGKSILIAEIAARWLEKHPTWRVVITTPTIALVRQLAGTLRERLGDQVALRYTEACQVPRACTIACCPSSIDLAGDLAMMGDRIGLWIADEAHRTETATMHEAIQVGHPFAVLGVTATPFLRDSSRSLSLYQDVWYTLTVQDALRDGIIVPWTVMNLHEEDLAERDLGVNEACLRLINRVDVYGIVNASTIDDAEAFVRYLEAHNIGALAVHSRLSQAEIAERIEAVKAGFAYQCLVHVDLLREGVDLPWLEWICLRRPPRSRVAAVQELGRVIRSYPDKSRAIILDPRDQMAELGLTYEATVGGQAWIEAEASKRPERERLEEVLLHENEPTVALDAGRRWMRLILRELEFMGRYERKIRRGSWRYLPSTDKQRDAINRMAWVWRTMSGVPAQCMGSLLNRSCILRRGDCADLLDLLHAVSPRGGGWPTLEGT